jgi:glycosyltransferase involved in cell wall biosynthesis
MDKESGKRIAYVMPPITLFGSSLNRPRELDPSEEYFFRFEEPIRFTNYSSQWIELWKVYTKPDGFLWLLVRLPLKLVRGKYLVFTSSTRDPNGIVTFLVSKLLRKPAIMLDTFYYWPEKLLAKLLWPFCRFAASHATVFSVPSERVRDFWKRAGVPTDKIKKGHGFVSMIKVDEKTMLRANQIKAKLGYQRIILFVGGLIERKGVEYLIRSFVRISKEVPNTGLLIVGDGPERNRLEALRNGLGLTDVHFAGFVPQQEKAIYYVLCDLFVLPSITLNVHEEWGLVVNEAMSVGKPVIVTDSVGCAHELVKSNVNGLIVPEKDVGALSKAAITLLSDDDARARMGKESKRIIEEGFTYEHSIDEFAKFVRSMLGQSY